MKKKDILSVFTLLSESIPEPKSELRYKSAFELLIAVILSAQATDVSVNKVTPALFQAAPTVQDMFALQEDGIKEYIKSIGLYNMKAKNIYLCCKQLIERHGGTVPSTRKELEALAGVGQKTAGVVLNVAFNELTIPVDTHVFRVSNRLGLVNTKTPNQTEAVLLKVVPPAFLLTAHHLLILHGRYTCKARQPLCSSCSLTSFCSFFAKSDHT